MTLEAWVDPSATSSGWRDVIYKGNDNYYLEGTSAGIGAPTGGGTFSGANANAFGSSPLTSNAWSYLALTYDGATLRLYVNGSLVGSQARAGAIASSTNPLQIGGDSLYGQYFSGLIDEVRIYNVAACSDRDPGGHGQRRELRRRGHPASEHAGKSCGERESRRHL